MQFKPIKKHWIVSNSDHKKFNRSFDEDSDYLLKHGIKYLDIKLMKDLVLS